MKIQHKDQSTIGCSGFCRPTRPGCWIAIIMFVNIWTVPTWAAVDSALQAIADRVTDSVGEVIRTTPRHRSGPVFVFEEYHNSRAGQVQIATMVTRLYHQQGLRIIGLEGAVKGPAPLPTGKYLQAVDGPTRRDVLQDLLREAEISGVEYAGATLPGLQIVGIENADEYKVRPADTDAPEFSGILLIAERILTQQQLQEIAAKLAGSEPNEAMDALRAADPWIKARLDAMKNPDLKLSSFAAETEAIFDKAKSLKVELPAEMVSALKTNIHFFRVAEKRSNTMADAVAGLARQNAGKPVAMVIGAAHTERVLRELEKEDVTAVVLRAKSFKSEGDLIGNTRFELKSQGLWGNDDPGSLGAILNPKKRSSIPEKKPPPVIGDLKRDGYASAQAAAKIAAKAVRNGEEFPKMVVDRLQALPGIKVDPASFEKKGYDVIFAFDIEDTNGRTQKVWVRAGTRPVGTQSPDNSLEAAFSELKKAEAESGSGGGKEPPKKIKDATVDDSDGGKNKKQDGKGDKKPDATKSESVGLLTNREVQAKFFASVEEARSQPSISL